MIIEFDGKKTIKDYLSENPKMVLNFHATWCGPCQALGAMLKEHFANDITILRVDIDKFRDLAVEYSVRGVPTMFLYNNSEIVDKQVGYIEEAQFRSWIK